MVSLVVVMGINWRTCAWCWVAQGRIRGLGVELVHAAFGDVAAREGDPFIVHLDEHGGDKEQECIAHCSVSGREGVPGRPGCAPRTRSRGREKCPPVPWPYRPPSRARWRGAARCVHVSAARSAVARRQTRPHRLLVNRSVKAAFGRGARGHSATASICCQCVGASRVSGGPFKNGFWPHLGVGKALTTSESWLNTDAVSDHWPVAVRLPG